MTNKKYPNSRRQNDVNLTKSELDLKNSTISGDPKANKSRRTALLGAIGVAGAASLPSEWKKPMIDGLVLPAHAQMSPSVITQSATTTITQEQIITITGGVISCTGEYTSAQKYIAGSTYVLPQTTAMPTKAGYYSVYFRNPYESNIICEDAMGGTTLRTSNSFGGEFGTSFYTDEAITFTYPTAATTSSGEFTNYIATRSSYTSLGTVEVSATTSVTVSS